MGKGTKNVTRVSSSGMIYFHASVGICARKSCQDGPDKRLKKSAAGNQACEGAAGTASEKPSLVHSAQVANNAIQQQLTRNLVTINGLHFG